MQHQAVFADGRANLVEQFTEPFPIRVIARIAGVPIEDFDQFKRWALEIIGYAKDGSKILEIPVEEPFHVRDGKHANSI